MPAKDEPKAPTERETCMRCWKAQSMCVCDFFEAIDNRTDVLVLQHPRERAHPIGTARFVELGLSRSQVHVANTLEQDLRVEPIAAPGAALLYPHRDAKDLSELPESERPEQLVVLDGTWPHARALYRANPWLETLPHVRLSPKEPSRYRIRREPEHAYVSTLESVLLALVALEPGLDISGLLDAFDRMQDAQIARKDAAGRAGRRMRRKAPRPFDRIPRWLGEDYEKIVAVYVETCPLSRRDPNASIVQLAALRLASGAALELLIEPTHAEARALFQEWQIAPDATHSLQAGMQALESFVGGGIAMTWNSAGERCLKHAGYEGLTRALRPISRQLALDPGRRPPLEATLRGRPPPATAALFSGRAPRRLAHLIGTAEWARALR